MSVRFSKMHGIGNDFVVLDRRAASAPLDLALVRAMADRHSGVGFDQLLTIEPPTRDDCVAAYRIWNTDGSSARQCGNGVRCLVAWLTRDGALAGDGLALEGPAGVVHARRHRDGTIAVEMGVPEFAPAAVPFLADADAPLHRLELAGLAVEIGVVAIGNPHAVLEVDDVAAVALEQLGPSIERHPRFPDRCNVGAAQVVAPDAIRLRVWERGVGETLACGSGACAAVAVLSRRGRVGPQVGVTLPGGTLAIDWPGPGRMLTMRGPASFVFEGEWAR